VETSRFSIIRAKAFGRCVWRISAIHSPFCQGATASCVQYMSILGDR
jgi:hypothetical protein